MSHSPAKAPLLLIDGVPVGELHYGVPEQPRLVGTFAKLPAYADYRELIESSGWNSADEEVFWAARRRLERMDLQVLYPNGTMKTLNRTLFQIGEGARFSHRLCAEDWLGIYKSEIADALMRRGPFRQIFTSSYKFVRLQRSMQRVAR